jgi:hypothetical protein
VKQDVLELVVLAIAIGFFMLPILLLLGADSAAVGVLAGAYASSIAVLAPIIARRRERDRAATPGDDRGGADG